MKNFWIGFRIWVVAVFMSTLLCAVFAVFTGDLLLSILLISFFGFLGLVFTLPVLTFITPIVDLAGKIPGSVYAKISWLATILILIGNAYLFGFSSLLQNVLDGYFGLVKLLHVPVSIAIFLSVMFSRTALIGLYKGKKTMEPIPTENSI